ncbi:hypothetical protein F5Y05DRAFT_409695 [Hypoxylon sp. FL0543]|nr:hypothetical protein F5Y05DRAFT_409695 [Hypoxylon sp. FL0543]
MKFLALPNVTVALAMCASLVAALPLETEGNTISTMKSIRSSDCSLSKIQECVDDTGLESSLCFKQVCAGTQVPSKRVKRQDDQCTEENLLQCAVQEWKEAEVWYIFSGQVLDSRCFTGHGYRAKNNHYPPLGPVLPAPTSPGSHPAVQSDVSVSKETLGGLTATLNGTAVTVGAESFLEKTPFVYV